MLGSLTAEPRRTLRWRRTECGIPLLLTVSALRSSARSRVNTRLGLRSVNGSLSPPLRIGAKGDVSSTWPHEGVVSVPARHSHHRAAWQCG